MNIIWRIFLVSAALVMASLPRSASACAACFGRSDSKLAQGMNMGILSLLVVVVFVLGGFAAFFVYLVRRSSMIPGTPAAAGELGPKSKEI